MALKDRINSLDKNKVIIGLLILVGAIMLPTFTKNHQYNILQQIYQSINKQDSGLLLLVSTKLVMLNTLRHLPIYVGAFILAEGLDNFFHYQDFAFLTTLIIIPITYQLISSIYDIAFVFAGPSYLTIIMIFLLHYLTRQIHHNFIKTIIISLFLFSIDWLDIIPFLSQFGFGKGEMTVSILEVTEFIEATHIMNFFGFTFSIIIMINALILTRVVIDYYSKLNLVEESRSKEEKIRKLELEAVKSRYFSEIKHLVHDLKTPLVTIQGLSGVIDMKINDLQISRYTDKISDSADKMSQMISEILYRDKKRELNIEELFDFLKIQLSLEEMADQVVFHYDEEIIIQANKVRLSRALINLIDNSLRAIDNKVGEINIYVNRIAQGKVKILVKDNGKGIPPDKIENVWQIGYTTSLENTGLGLHFVKEVIESHAGTIKISSQLNQGTEAIIILPEVINNE